MSDETPTGPAGRDDTLTRSYVKLNRTASGQHTWQIAVGAGDTRETVRAAMLLALELDGELEARYPGRAS